MTLWESQIMLLWRCRVAECLCRRMGVPCVCVGSLYQCTLIYVPRDTPECVYLRLGAQTERQRERVSHPIPWTSGRLWGWGIPFRAMWWLSEIPKHHMSPPFLRDSAHAGIGGGQHFGFLVTVAKIGITRFSVKVDIPLKNTFYPTKNLFKYIL